MINAIISDVSLVLLFPKDPNYTGSLNALYKEKKDETNFNFFEHFRVNEELLAIYKNHKADRKMYIFTSDAIQDEPVLQPYWKDVFDDIFSAARMGIHKSEADAYTKLSQHVSVDPNEILYIDDSATNITAAQTTGLNAHIYETNEKIEELLRRELS